MKIIFTHAYYLSEDPKEQKIQRPYPPLGLLYLSAWLEDHGFENEVFDSTFSDSKTQRAHLLATRPEVLAIYTNLMTKPQVVLLMRFVHSQESLRHCLIVLGGPDVSYNIDNYLAAGADVLVIGEGEQSMLELVQAKQQGNNDFSQISGLALRQPDGTVFRTPARTHLKEVDELPAPARHKIDLQRYLDTWKKYHGNNSLTVSTQRGCPYTCRWCSTAVYGQSYRRRSPARVAEELQFLQKTYQPDHIWFVDDVFTVSHKWLAAFRDEVKARGVSLPFECITRAERLSEEVIALLKDSGCFRVWIGAESGSQRILDAMDRRVDAQKVEAMIVEAKRQGIETGTFIMLGYPGETESDIQLTLDYLKRANPDLFTITIAYPIKGTGLYDDVKDKLTTAPDWNTSTDRDLDFARTYPRRYYDFAVRWVVNAVHLHKKQLAGQALSPGGLKLLAKVWVARAGMRWYRGFSSQVSEYELVKQVSPAA